MPQSQDAAGESRTSTTDVPTPPEGGSLIDASAELIQSAVAYARQETGDLVQDKIVRPVQSAGVVAGLAVAIGLLVSLGCGFVAAGMLLVLAQWLGWPGALFAVGGVLLLGSAAVVYARSRRMKS